jgi:hypothetical protein
MFSTSTFLSNDFPDMATFSIRRSLSIGRRLFVKNIAGNFMRFKQLFLFSLLAFTHVNSSHAQEPHTESVYGALQTLAHHKALGMVRMYFGTEAKITEFSPSVAGSYRIIISDGGASREMYLMSDLQSLIEGKLYSTLVRSAASAHGISTLEKYSQRNQAVDNAANFVKSSVEGINKDKSITVNTAASLLDGGFSDLRKTEQPAKYKVKDSREISAEFYQKITELQNITVGSSKKEIYLFIDLNCPACRKSEPRLKPFIERGQLTVNYIPVGFLLDSYDRKNKDITDSEAKAMYALIPQSEDKRALLLQTLLSASHVDELIDVEAPQALRNRGYKYMKENTLSFFKLPVPATPMAVYLSNGYPRFKALSENNTTPSKLTDLIEQIDDVDS